MGAIAGRVASNFSAASASHLLRPFENNAAGRLATWSAEGIYLAQMQVGDDSADPAAPAHLHLVADARLDDRNGLASSLGVNAALASDHDLIIRAYQKWGPDCVSHLTGDFAIALWDAAERRLFCARDQMGVRPFYYRHDNTALSFATSLATLSKRSDALDAGRIATFIEGFDDSVDETNFAAIRRLPAAHWLLWTADQLRVERYWTLAPETVSRNEDFAAGFRHRLFNAVDDRLRGTPDIAAMLSGGLDSSSIVSTAAARHRDDAGFNLRTFSFSYPRSPQFDERAYGEAVTSAYGLVTEYVEMDDIAPLDGLANMIEAENDLFFAPGVPKIARILASARKSGFRVVLDGHGGDEVASHGFGRLSELARDSQWLTLYRELRGVSALYGASPLSTLGKYYFSHGFGLKLRNRLWRGRPRGPSPAGLRRGSVLTPGFAASSNIVERTKAWAAARSTAAADESSLHIWNVSSPTVPRSFEALARAGDHMGVELRFPFYDRRVVTYALAVPEGEKLRDGWTRSVLRRAMKDVLPEKVRWRRTKINFGSELSGGLARHHKGLFDSILRENAPVSEYVDIAATREIASRLFADPSEVAPQDVFTLWRVAFLGMWLESRNAAAPQERVLT